MCEIMTVSLVIIFFLSKASMCEIHPQECNLSCKKSCDFFLLCQIRKLDTTISEFCLYCRIQIQAEMSNTNKMKINKNQHI